MVKTPPRKIAVLIDADNLQSDLLENMLKAVEKHGRPMIRRIYGDWRNESLQRWDRPAKRNSFELIQVSEHSNHKNATDIGLVIDAMDILFQGKMDGFCIVSNDSDFTGLCTRLRNAGMFVMGIGGQHAHMSLRSACEEWIFIHNIKPANYKKRKYRPHKKRRKKENQSAESTPQPTETTAETNDTITTPSDDNQSRWSMIATSLPFFRRTSQADSNEPDTTKQNIASDQPSTGADWQSKLQQASPLLNGKTATSGQTSKDTAANNGAGSHTKPDTETSPQNASQSTANRTSPNRANGKTATTNKNENDLSQHVSESSTPSNQQVEKTPTPSTKDDVTQKAKSKNTTTQNKKANKPKKASPDKTKTKSVKDRQDEYEQWKPLMDDLSAAYVRNLLIAAFYIADEGDEWLSLTKFANQVQRLSPDLKFKDLGYKRLLTLIKKHPNVIELRTTKQDKKTYHDVKLVKPTS